MGNKKIYVSCLGSILAVATAVHSYALAPLPSPPAAATDAVPVSPAAASAPAPSSPLPLPAAAAPAPVTPPPPARSALSDAATQSGADIIQANTNLLLTPMHLGNTSLMFTKEEMNIIAPFLELYDNASHPADTQANTSNKDDLSALLESLHHENVKEKTNAPPPLPNIYLGSIVYYSPSHWSVWINDHKLINTQNAPSNQFYISRISRSEAEIIWKAPFIADMAALWKQRTHNGANPLDNITVDEAKGTVTLDIHANQTFLPRALVIHEGLVIPTHTAVPSPSTPTAR